MTTHKRQWKITVKEATRVLILFLACAGMTCAGVPLMGSLAFPTPVAGGRAKQKPGPPQDLPGHINYLVRQLYGVSLDDSSAITSQVQDLVMQSLTSWMSTNAYEKTTSPYPVDVRVRMHMEQYFSKLHYPFFCHPVVFVRPWNGSELIGAGYTLGWSDFERVNVLALFESKGGKTQRMALAQLIPRTDMHYAFLPLPPSGAFRFIVYGNRLGKSQPRLSAVLYSFDGQKLSNLWERQDLYDGKIHVTPETVTLRYLIERDYIQAVQQGQLPPWHKAVYKVTPQGLALQTEQLMPYKSAQ